ncbi:MAG TPA: exodeoxyribonuclease VII large subunit [Planctomycetaceae bacterium]|nr:exodeoxyribonuclease VII large subunit [Planctomycetaceae bacterium]
MAARQPEPDPEVLTVSEVTRQIKDSLEGNFPDTWVQGEISNLKRATSGHLYFTLKDAGAQLGAILWRSGAARLKFDLHDGLEVIAAGAIEVYEARGTYSLVVNRLAPVGMGGLELAFRQLFEKLQAEGLFDPARKRGLPMFPRRIALVTSPTGAAVRDMLQVLARRWPATPVVIVPVAVQGAEAAPQIAAALRDVHRIPGVDVVITGRGGGSLEDLWAFNTEIVARAIHACQVPVVSAVGHEVDVTIADHVADRRALTPTEAATLVTPDRQELRQYLLRAGERLAAGLKHQARTARARLEGLSARRALARPHERLHELSRRVDDLDARLRRGLRNRLDQLQAQLASRSAALHALSPLQVLGRGYTVTRIAGTGQVVQESGQAPVGTRIETRLTRGRLVSRVEEQHDQ